MKIFLTKIKILELSSNLLLLLSSSYIALILNLPFLIKVYNAVTALDNYNPWFLLSVPLMLLSLILLINSLFAIRWLTKPLLIFTIIIASIIFYTTIYYGTVFDFGMIENVAETDAAEAFSYLNFPAIIFFIIFGLVPCGLIYKVKLQYQPFSGALISRLKLLAFSLVPIVIIASAFYSNYASFGRNNKHLVGYITPYKMFDASIKYLKTRYIYPPLKYQQLDQTPSIERNDKRQHVTVLVLGETARAQNFSLNGYNKPTNQFTEPYQLISFSHMTSCGTATAISVPCMFSRLDKQDYDKRLAIAQQNALDLIQQAGADVLWIDNDGGCKGVCKRVKTINLSRNANNPLCDGDTCFDEALIPPLTQKLKQLTHDNTLIVLHMMGSHGPTYFKRYPQEKRIFSPDCPQSSIQHCSHEQLINTYDNTIAYTDYVLSKVIEKLEQQAVNQDISTNMLYISDHGESLGEKGIYLHGFPYKLAPEEQTHIPMLYWENILQANLNQHCLQAIANNKLSHDNVFDSLLGLMSVHSSSYKIKQDPFAECKLHHTIATHKVQLPSPATITD